MIAVTSLATLRNWIVAGELVPIASSGPVNLSLGNTPAIPLVPHPEHQAFYDRLGFDRQYTQVVVEYVRHQPRAFLAGLSEKAKYTLGFDAILPGSGRSNFYVVTWAAALAGLFLMSRTSPLGLGSATLIPALLALSHFAVVVMIFPHGYSDPPYSSVLRVARAICWRDHLRCVSFGGSRASSCSSGCFFTQLRPAE